MNVVKTTVLMTEFPAHTSVYEHFQLKMEKKESYIYPRSFGFSLEGLDGKCIPTALRNSGQRKVSVPDEKRWLGPTMEHLNLGNCLLNEH